MADAPRPKLRWFQFSLRTLFVFVTLCAIACSWLGVRLQRARQQRAAVEALRNLSGNSDVLAWVSYDDDSASNRKTPRGPAWLRSLLGDDFFDDVTFVGLMGPGVTNDTLRLLGQVPSLGTLGLDSMKVTDDGIKHLAALSQLKDLCLARVNITDDGFASLHRLVGLRGLAIDHMHITTAGLKQVVTLSHLERLGLMNCPDFDDAQLVHLAGMRNLREITLESISISDVGLARLAALTKLRRLTIQFTSVTENGIKGLQRALPDCRIRYRP